MFPSKTSSKTTPEKTGSSWGIKSLLKGWMIVMVAASKFLDVSAATRLSWGTTATFYPCPAYCGKYEFASGTSSGDFSQPFEVYSIPCQLESGENNFGGIYPTQNFTASQLLFWLSPNKDNPEICDMTYRAYWTNDTLYPRGDNAFQFVPGDEEISAPAPTLRR